MPERPPGRQLLLYLQGQDSPFGIIKAYRLTEPVELTECNRRPLGYRPTDVGQEFQFGHDRIDEDTVVSGQRCLHDLLKCWVHSEGYQRAGVRKPDGSAGWTGMSVFTA